MGFEPGRRGGGAPSSVAHADPYPSTTDATADTATDAAADASSHPRADASSDVRSNTTVDTAADDPGSDRGGCGPGPRRCGHVSVGRPTGRRGRYRQAPLRRLPFPGRFSPGDRDCANATAGDGGRSRDALR